MSDSIQKPTTPTPVRGHERLKLALFAASVLLLAALTTLSVVQRMKPAQAYQHRVILFCRGDQGGENCSEPTCFSGDYSGVLDSLGAVGFEYVGPLHNNGANCTYIEFRRDAALASTSP